MAVPVVESSHEDNLNVKSSRRLSRRHYKKDSRFVLDLYTLTYDSHESLDSLGDLSERRIEANNIQESIDINRITNLIFDNEKDERDTSGHFYKKASLQSRLYNGKNFQSCAFGQQFFSLEDNQFEEEAFSLPILHSKPALNVADTNSLPTENQQTVPVNVFFSSKLQRTCDKNNNVKKYVDMSNQGRIENKKESCSLNIHKDVAHSTHCLQDFQNEICTSLKRVYSKSSKEQSNSSIICSIKYSLEKVGFDDWNKSQKSLPINRPMLMKMNSNQLRTIVNDLQSYIKDLNEQLMKMLTERDELHMNRDTLINHIKDITAYLDIKPDYRFQKFNLKNCLLNAKFMKNNVNNSKISSLYSKNIISGLRFGRLASYIKN